MLVMVVASAWIVLAQGQPATPALGQIPCSAVRQLPDGRWQMVKPVTLAGGRKIAAGTFLGRGGDIDDIQVDGARIRVDVGERCGRKPG